MNKISSAEYLESIQGDDPAEGDLSGNPDTAPGEEWAEQGEAEQIAAAAPGPKLRMDGSMVGTPRPRPLTQAQQNFARAVIEGKTLKAAYREAYPDAQASDRTVSVSASKLVRDERIARMIRDSWEETQEALAEDVAATRRYVMRQLVALSKGANQEGSRLKALELLGRAAGMWRDQQQTAERALTAAELKAQLAGHLRLVRDSSRKGRGDAETAEAAGG